MNSSFDTHFPEQVWEEYAMGRLSEEVYAPMEEHLLICPACQDLLAEVDGYIRVAKTAAARSKSPKKRGMAAETLA